MTIGPVGRLLVVNPGLNAAKYQSTAEEGVTIDPRAAKVIKAVTGITLGKYGEVDDNPAGGMPPWDVILDINDTFNGNYKTAATPSSIAAILERHHFTPPASYDPNLLFGVWDGDRPKADGSTIDVQA